MFVLLLYCAIDSTLNSFFSLGFDPQVPPFVLHSKSILKSSDNSGTFQAQKIKIMNISILLWEFLFAVC